MFVANLKKTVLVFNYCIDIHLLLDGKWLN